jgi:hypothetical protein
MRSSCSKKGIRKGEEIMKRNWVAIVVFAGGLEAVMFGQQYPQQYPQEYPQQNTPYQGDPNYNPQYGNGQYNDNGQYAGDPGYGPQNGDPTFNGSPEGIDAPAPPPAPSYAYQRPPEPGPGYYWVDGYWNYLGRRYTWVGGYWMRPPYAGGYWVAPRYSGGRFFGGFWGGGGRHFDRGYVHNEYRYQGRVLAPRYSYRSPAPSRNEFRGGYHHEGRSGNREHRGGRR